MWRATALFLCLAAAGCNGNGQLFSGAPRGSVAFEAIDGPPAPIFRKLVARMNDEAESRRIAVVSRESSAQYRVRAYLSAQVHPKMKSNTVAWVWDVYDSAETRVVRLSGEEQAGPYRRDGWASADDKVLARIAQNGMGQLADFLNASGSAAPVVAPEREEMVAQPAVAKREDASFAPAVAEVPTPRRRPELAAVADNAEAPRTLTKEDLLAYAARR
ncbi:MAG: hypothetical protein AB7K04_05690 [Pseudorhodoplanes sp.]